MRFKSGKSFRVLYATYRGRLEAEHNSLNKNQRYWHGLGKTSDIKHDSAIYRAVRNEIEKLEKQNARIKRVELDYEMKSRIAKETERARHEEGDEAAFVTKIEQAQSMSLPTDNNGTIHYPDARIEYEDSQGSAGRVDVEVASDNYRANSIAAKASAGFKMYASGPKAVSRVSSALGLKDPGRGGGGGGGARDQELFEL